MPPRPERNKRRPPRPARRKPAGPVSPKTSTAAGERLQKVLAAAGHGSRRKCEELITAGRVEVDRRVITELGTRVDAASQEVRVDGVALPRARHLYYAVNKPDGVISTSRDPSGRPRVIDLAPERAGRLFAVGRLDLHSEGLILLTNDGDLANRLTHPRYGIQKVYRVMVAGAPTRETLDQLRNGIRLAEAFVRVPGIEIRSRQKQSAVLEMVLDEGRNREIRRVLAKVGHKVLRLVRIAVGPVRLGNMASGECRPLSRQEIQALRKATGLGHPTCDT
ncbi:MAG TPA: pseudouridine synthase [Thermoguttaceae bacterium]|nr:pseudouridine synthase [Thermoguttaceae bacterium]